MTQYEEQMIASGTIKAVLEAWINYRWYLEYVKALDEYWLYIN